MLEKLFSRPFAIIFILLLTSHFVAAQWTIGADWQLILLILSLLLYVGTFKIHQALYNNVLLLLCLAMLIMLHIDHVLKARTNNFTSAPIQLKGHFTIVVKEHLTYPTHNIIRAQLCDIYEQPLVQISIWNKDPIKRLYHGDTLKGNFYFQKIIPQVHRLINSYDHFLLTQGIWYKGNTQTTSTWTILNFKEFSFIRSFQQYANALQSSLKSTGQQKQTIALLCGLLLGDKSSMEGPLKTQFREGGLSHILAVSGMHLVFFFIVLQSCIRALRKLGIRTTQAAEILFLLAFIWFFAAITGFGVAIVRAAIMLTIYQGGTLLSRRADASNTLLASASLLLMYDPLFLYDVGFQLSFVAVAALFWLNPLLITLWKPSMLWQKYFWELLGNSLFIQLALTPLCIYHFAGFPVYFLLTNLVWIPLSSMLMLAGILLLLVHFFAPWFEYFLMWVTHQFCELGFKWLQYTNQWPHAYLEPLWIEKTECTAFYAGLLFIIATYQRITIRIGFIFLLLEFILCGFFFYRELKRIDNPTTIIYRTNQQCVAETYHQKTCYTTQPHNKALGKLRERFSINQYVVVDSLRLTTLTSP